MTTPPPADPNARVVYWGPFLIFVVKVCNFVALKVWDEVGPLFPAAPQ